MISPCKIGAAVVAAAMSFGISAYASTPDNAAYVNPIIGTNGMGHTFPGACAPFGIVQLSPDTTSTANTSPEPMNIARAISTATPQSSVSATLI